MSLPGRKRILFHTSAPWAGTGYGQQCAQLAPRLKEAGHDVVLSSTWGLNGASLTWAGITVLPSDDQWGNLRLADYAQLHEAEIVLTLLDVWVLKNPRFKDLNMACWVPVDHAPTPPMVLNFFQEFGARPIAMSRFGEGQLRKDGLDPLYVPHAIDTKVFSPQDKEKARSILGIKPGQFVVSMVANNAGHTPARKAFPQALMAFSELQQKHSDVVLHLHTEMTGRRSQQNFGVDLFDLCARYGIPVESVRYTDPVSMDVGLPPEVLANLYSASDVLLNPSYGEGFGIPIIEAQACGTPVIATDWTAMTELVGSGWLVGGEPWDDVDHRAFYLAPSVPEIVAALEQAYERREDESLGSAAREFALKYDADTVFEEHWVPVIDKIGGPREVPPLAGINRAERRRMARARTA